MLNKRLLRLIPKIYFQTVKAVVFQWLSLILNIIIIVAISRFLNCCYIDSVNNIVVIETIFVVILCVLLRGVFTKINIKITSGTAQKAKRLLRNIIFDKLCEIGMEYKSSISTAEAVQVSVEGIDQLETYFSQYMPQLFYSLISVLTLFVVFCFFSVKVAVVFLICVPIIPLSIILVQKFAKRLLSKYWNSYTNLGDSFLENIQGLTTLKIYGSDEMKHNEMNVNAEHFRKATMRVLIMQLNSISIMDMVAFGGAAVGIAVALLELSKGNISFFYCIAIILLSSEFFIPLRQLGSFFHVAMNGVAAADKIFRILDRDTHKIKSIQNIEGCNIKFDRVYFAYEEEDVLKNVSFEMSHKGLISLIGKSGCGKSTIASILTGRSKGYRGSIKIGNTELSEISENQLMNMVTLVSHNSHIFKGTVEYNLKMGNKKATESEMLAALEKVNLIDFVNSENGLKTEIAEEGANLSGGQRQRLALARAILHNTPIYIFDEATSNIDAESEEAIINVIGELAKNKLVILITHRLADAVSSDKIVVIKMGCVVNEGKHKELMEFKNHYSELFKKQQSLESLKGGAFDE